MISFVIKIGLALTALTSIVALLPDIRMLPDPLNQAFILVIVPGFQLMNTIFPFMQVHGWIIVSLMIYIKLALWAFAGANWVYNKLTAIA